MNKITKEHLSQKVDKLFGEGEISEMRHLADEMEKAISTEYEKRVLADERKLEAVLKENGWRKASDVAREIFAELGKLTCTNEEDYRIFAELKKKYIGEDTNVPTKESEGER